MGKGARNRARARQTPEEWARAAVQLALRGNCGGGWEGWDRCLVCGVGTAVRPIRPDYMVRPEVWQDGAGLRTNAGVAHPDCLASLLGRPLVLDDFQDIPFNRPIREQVRTFGPILPTNAGTAPGGSDE